MKSISSVLKRRKKTRNIFLTKKQAYILHSIHRKGRGNNLCLPKISAATTVIATSTTEQEQYDNDPAGIIAQTMLDQLVTDENSQMLKALIPYLSFSGQRILAAYAKTQELCNTLQLFSRPQNDMQICSSRPMNPMELLNDIRKFSYGENRKKLDQAVNMFAMLEMLMTINE